MIPSSFLNYITEKNFYYMFEFYLENDSDISKDIYCE